MSELKKFTDFYDASTLVRVITLRFRIPVTTTYDDKHWIVSVCEEDYKRIDKWVKMKERERKM